ncbi:MAG: anti-phage ZorAB system protein ZorA [Bacteriovoracia bacterium]
MTLYEVVDSFLFYGCNGFILLFCFIQWKQLRSRTREIRFELSEANKLFSKENPRKYFAEEYESIHKNLLSNKTLSHKWHEFTEHLIYPGPRDKDQVFMNSIMPSSFFSSETLLPQRLDLRWINSVPGKITALGILGTFIGLSFGVYLAQAKLVGGTSEEMMKGLQYLLSGASLAFVTSLLGIIGSLFYSAYEKKILNEIDSSINDFCDNLEKALKFLTKEQLARDQLSIQQEQLKVLESFSNDLAISIGNTLDSKFSGQISGGFQNLVSSIESLKEVQADFSNDLMKSLADKLSGGLSSMADEKKNDAMSALKYMQESMVSQMEKMLASQDEMQKTTKLLVSEISTSLMSGQTKINEELIGTVSKLQQNFLDLSTSLTSKVESSLEGVSSKMEELNIKMSNSQAESMRAFETLMTRVSENLVKASEVSSQAMVGNINTSANKMGETVEMLNRSLKSSAEMTSESLNAMFKGLNTSVDKFGENVIDLNRYIEKNKEVAALSGKTAETYKEIVIANKVVGEQFGAAAARVNEFSSNILGLTKTLAAFSSDMQSSIVKIKEVNEVSAKTWENYSARFEGVDTALSEAFGKLEEGTREYNKILHSYVTELSASSDSIVGRFADAVEELELVFNSVSEAKTKRS